MKKCNLIILFLILSIYLSQEIFSSDNRITINIKDSYSFHCIKVLANSGEFYPSNCGGVAVVNRNGDLFQPWSSGIKFSMLKSQEEGNRLSAEWLMYKENDFYFHYGISFEQNVNGLVIHIKDLGEISDNSLPKYYAKAYALYLDRCENAKNPIVVGVPYLTMFNILFTNNCFVSMYFDWNKTNASQIVVYNNKSFSATSEYYSEYALYNPLTNGMRNKLDETIYLKVSDNFDDVLPDLPNPVSIYKEESSKRIIFDDWDNINKVLNNIRSLMNAGILNIWHIIHNVQRSNTTSIVSFYNPAQDNPALKEICDYDLKSGNLFALHENYCEMYTKSTEFSRNNLSLNSNGKYIFNWYDKQSQDTSYLVKPDKIFAYLNYFSRAIHSTYNTNSAYHDVSSSYDPSKYVDYDYRTDGAGKFITPYHVFEAIADTLRMIHQGPVSGEGLAHFLYIGFYDDISSAQIHTAKSLPGSYGTETEGGFYKPLLVNFDLLKMKEKTMVHGVGYYERFFYKDRYWEYMGRSRDSALIYAATELAYGHGSFISKSSYNFIEQGLIEYNYVYPMQIRYAKAKVKKILYSDNSELVDISEYIRRHPYTFDRFGSDYFLSQAVIKYDNGVVVYVNRHPKRKWVLKLNFGYGFYDYHVVVNGKDSLYVGFSNGHDFVLPPANGWLCYSP